MINAIINTNKHHALYQRMRTLFSLRVCGEWDILDGPLWQRIWVQGIGGVMGRRQAFVQNKSKGKEPGNFRVNSKSARTVV